MPAQVQTPPPGMNQQPPIQKPAPAPEPPLPKWRLVGVISGYGRASRAVFDFGLSTPKILTKGERLDRATTVAAVEPNGVKLTRGTETIEVQPW